jgi:excisionase family DNA binding protein
MSQLIKPEEAARYLNLSKATLARGRAGMGIAKGLKFYKLGIKAIRYKKEHLDEWLDEISKESGGQNE